MSSLITYVDVILPLALPQDYTYAVSIDLAPFVKMGQRIIVQFGKNRYYSAIIKRIHHQKPLVDAKLIEGIADEEPIVTERQLKFWSWMSRYYMCTEGEVMNAALPSGLKLSSETKIRYNENYEGTFDNLSEEEFLIVQALRAQQELRVPDVQALLKKKHVYPLLKTLFNLGIAISSEEIVERFKPRTEAYVKLNELYKDEAKLESLFEELSRAPKQVELLLAFTQLHHKNKFIRKNELLKLSGASAAVLSALIKRNVFTEFKMVSSRLGNFQTEEVETPVLSAEQQIALIEIKSSFEKQKVVLLQGITGSGKTNVYMELIKEAIAENKQVLYLLPEIALTAQIINRLHKVFGNLVGVYHSKFNQNERVEIWNKVLNGQYKIVIAARSGLFLPYQNLDLIIVDEEHDASLKQVDPAPRYQARDASVMLASYFGANVILGSATPSVESAYNAETGKYAITRLDKRYGGLDLPEVIVANVRDEMKRKRMQGSFSTFLVDEMNETLQRKEQIILFINRRGFANYQICKTCNYVYKCKNCDVSLTYHKFSNQLKCHYCGYFENVQNKCKSCGAIDLDIVGSGTQKIEDELTDLFPTARVGRLDYDATKTKNGHAEIISKFENREIDILVGTQMVSKGLDFDHVTLVGVMNADQLIFHPGFRSFERAFQLLIQVAGRAGRRSKKGRVVIQTADPTHPVIQNVMHNNFKAMYERELLTRRQFLYPPFARVIEVQLRHKEVQRVEKAALFLANELRKKEQGKVLGPATPFVSRVNNFFIRDVLIKSTLQTKDLAGMKNALQQIVDDMKAIPELKGVWIHVNVDP